jgi:8-oxo-dGTP pyrophosphatase MutT (NUDIX family)
VELQFRPVDPLCGLRLFSYIHLDMKTVSDNELRTRLTALAGNELRECLTIEGYRRAGVLVPIIMGTGTPELLFTKRTELVETHKGQISFPGGMMDPADGDVIRTALREAWEEVGIPDSAVEVAGLLDDLPTPTGFIITPVVGIIQQLPSLAPNIHEVADVFQVPLSFFAAPKNGKTEIRNFRGKQQEVWYYKSGSNTIWGATAMIVRSLLKRLHLA